MEPPNPDGKHYEWLCAQEVYNDLGGAFEIAFMLRVPPRRVRRWIAKRATTNCPLPVRSLSMMNLYRISDWLAWHDLRRTRLSGEKDGTKWNQP